jgi:hypothetical protein
MKMTLLSMVQDILNDMDSDEVNGIEDTAESLQVAQIIRTTFYEMIARKEWPHLRRMTTLQSVSDSETPNYLSLPDSAVRMDYLAYNRRLSIEDRDIFHEVAYLYPDEFIRHCNRRNTDNDNVIVVTDPTGGVRLNILNDHAPQYWTSFDDKNIVFDAYVSAVEDTMRGSESQAELYNEPTSWLMEDSFIPDLPGEAFPALLSEAKSVAFMAIKQMANQKEEQRAVRQHNMLAQRGWVTKGGVRYNNYGRRSGKKAARNNGLFNKRSYTGGG